MTQHPPVPKTITALRGLITGFIQSRCAVKLDRLKDEDVAQRQWLMQAHQPAIWLADAARRALQIQLATHTLKPIHPDARGSTIYRDSGQLSGSVSDPVLVASHVVVEAVDDVVGNAAALDVYKLLKLAHAGESLLARARRRDIDFHAALIYGDLPEAGQAATEWITRFAALAEPAHDPASHAFAKQLYFPLGNGRYHLLAPLFPTTLVHAWHGRQINDRFSDATQAAKAAKRSEKRPEGSQVDKAQPGKPGYPGYRDYPDLAVQKFGGTKPQNISQLNSERGGAAHLLSALPPFWPNTELNMLMKTSSVFMASGVLFTLFETPLKTLRQFLVSANQGPNKQRSILEWRQVRGAQVDQLIDNIQAWATTVQMRQPGWSLRVDCQLNDAERQWLDPHAPPASGRPYISRALNDKATIALAQAYANRATEAPGLSEEKARTMDAIGAIVGVDLIDEEEQKADAQADAQALELDQKIANTFANWLNALLTTQNTLIDHATHGEWVQRWQALPVEAHDEA